MLRKIGFLGLGLSLVMGLSACDDDDDVNGNDMSRVRVLLTDAPGDLVSAEVEIEEIYFQSSGGRVTLYSEGETFDLLELQNGVTTELASVLIPEGTYNELRIVIGDAMITTEDGRTFSTENNTLQCPSCAQSGLKVKFPGESVTLEEGSQVLLIDFDVAQSFGHAAGQSGRWVMHPVVHATNFVASGSISGEVAFADGFTAPSCGGEVIGLDDITLEAESDNLLITAVPEDDGDFRFFNVVPGDYTMGFSATTEFGNGDVATFEATSSVAEVEVGSGSGSVVNYTITNVTCELGETEET